MLFCHSLSKFESHCDRLADKQPECKEERLVNQRVLRVVLRKRNRAPEGSSLSLLTQVDEVFKFCV